MAITTYAELQAAILSWLARSPDDEDLVVTHVTDFISLAEARIRQDLRVREMIERVAAPINERTEKMPARFVEGVSAALIKADGSRQPLKNVTAHYLSRGWDNLTGDPNLYAIVGGEILFGPALSYDDTVPNEDRPKIELIGYFSPKALSDDTTENDILKYYPQIYLYASLMEATAFITADQLKDWASMYSSAVDMANSKAIDAQHEAPAQEPPPDYLVI